MAKKQTNREKELDRMLKDVKPQKEINWDNNFDEETIEITDELKESLDSLKENESESYADVIERLLKNYEKEE